jgi:hypothetical protein
VLPELFRAQKTIVGKPAWQEADSEWFRITCPLAIDGEVIEGLELRGGAHQALPNRAIRLHMQHYPAKGPCTPLVRAEWRPIRAHTNPNCGALPLMRIEGSHVHCFDMNWLEEAGRMRAGNLQCARPLNPDPVSYEAFLAIVKKEFNISNLDMLEMPSWREGTLFGL